MGKRKRSGSFSKSEEIGVKKSGDDFQDDSQEEMDNEATVLQPLLKGSLNGVRCSARVLEKQEKMRRETSPSKQTISEATLPQTNGNHQHQSSSSSAASNSTAVNNNNTTTSNMANNVSSTCGKQQRLSPSSNSVEDSSILPSSGAHSVNSNSNNSTLVISSNNVNSTTTGESTMSTSVSTERCFSESSVKRKKRNWELWSQDDKQLFFEALNEFGKDFDAIQNYLKNYIPSKPRNTSGKGKSLVQAGGGGNSNIGGTTQQASSSLSGINSGGASNSNSTNLLHQSLNVPKNKDQVRHFYYRTWNKISKYLDFPSDMKKASQELYGLINFGELRKKQRVLNSKNALKLCELVEKGLTTIKVRGKTFRIKTPICRALKRLNQLDDQDQVRVPNRVLVEMIPKDAKTWSTVQALSHNPRIRMYCQLQRTVSSIILFLEERWKSVADRLKEEMSETFGGKPKPRLCLVPVDCGEMSMPLFKLMETTSSSKISLRSFTENILKREKITRHNHASGSGSSPHTQKKQRKRKDTYSSIQNGTASEADLSDNDGNEKDGKDVGQPTSPLDISDDSLKQNDPASAQVDELEFDEHQQQNHTAEEGELNEKEGHLSPNTNNNTNIKTSPTTTSGTNKSNNEFIYNTLTTENIKKGWNAQDSGVMTLGQLYLMLNQNDKLYFHYYWDSNDNKEDRGTKVLDKLISLALLLKKKKAGKAKTPSGNIFSTTGPQTPVQQPQQQQQQKLLPTSCNRCGFVNSSTAALNNHNHQTIIQLQENKPASSVCLPVVQDQQIQYQPQRSTFENGIITIDLGTTDKTTTIQQSSINVSNIASFKKKECENASNNNNLCKITLTQLTPTDSKNMNVSEIQPVLSIQESDQIISFNSSNFTNCSSSSYNPIPMKLKPETCSTNLNTTQRNSCSDGNGSELESENGFKKPYAPVQVNKNKVPPKPFLDLPKGNRRLGRRKNMGRVVIPRLLPLVQNPKPPDTSCNINILTPVHSAAAVTATASTISPSDQIITYNIQQQDGQSSLNFITGSNAHEDQNVSKLSSRKPTTIQVGEEVITIHSSFETSSSDRVYAEITSLERKEFFDDLLKTDNSNSKRELGQLGGSEESNLSLSSFMDISLPESTKLVANECLNSDKFMDVNFETSNSSLLSLGFLDDSKSSSNKSKSLQTPIKNQKDPFLHTSPPRIGSLSPTWNYSNDLSFSGILGNFEMSNNSTLAEGNDLNFQSVIEAGVCGMNFTGKIKK